MLYKLRDYQQAASDAAVAFFNDDVGDNALLVLPTGCGKSLIIADIAFRLNANVLVFCPSKEITEQNHAKMLTYDVECSMYSASVGQKIISRITFATIGSARVNKNEFEMFDYVIVDEAHGVNSENGMYCDFLNSLGKRALGLTATPFRLTSERYFDKESKAMRTRNSMLTLLTNEDCPFFSRILYKVQVYQLLQRGYLASLRYFDCRPKGWNENKMFKNSTGCEYSESSVRWMMKATNHITHTANVCNNLPVRNGVIVFMQFVEDAQELCSLVPDSAFICGKTTKKNRERILREFRDGTIKVLANVGTLTTGLDIPKIDTIVMARPTLSLAIYYQCIGRAIRPYEGKDAWVIDTVGNFNRFGEVSNLRLEVAKATGTEEMFGYTYDYDSRTYKWKQLTGIYLN